MTEGATVQWQAGRSLTVWGAVHQKQPHNSMVTGSSHPPEGCAQDEELHPWHGLAKLRTAHPPSNDAEFT